MKTMYFHREGNRVAVVDVNPVRNLFGNTNSMFPGTDPLSMVTRLMVPLEMRGKGIAKKLLRELTADADKERVVLMLYAAPYPGTDFKRLIELYESFGFRTQEDGAMYRQYAGKINVDEYISFA